MDANERELIEQAAKRVIGAAYEVSNVLGTGFLEKVYENALVHELRANGIRVEAQKAVPVFYKRCRVGDYFADLLVENRLIVELKCVESLAGEHLAQCLNYLRATNAHLALLLNFQHSRVQVKRVVREL
ncbi:MAG: GxxExxY protein [Phycisphaeraceae bacterium]